MSTTEDRSGHASGTAEPQAPGPWRTDLQRRDLSVPALGHQRFAVAGHDTGMWIG